MSKQQMTLEQLHLLYRKPESLFHRLGLLSWLPWLRLRLPLLRFQLPRWLHRRLCPQCNSLLRFRLHLLRHRQLPLRHLLRPHPWLLLLPPSQPRPSLLQRLRLRLQRSRLWLQQRRESLRQQRHQFKKESPLRPSREEVLFCPECEADTPFTKGFIPISEETGIDLKMCGICETVVERKDP